MKQHKHTFRMIAFAGLCAAAFGGCATSQLANYRTHVNGTVQQASVRDSEFSVAFGLDGVNQSSLAAARTDGETSVR